MSCFGQAIFLHIYQNVWKNSVTIHSIIFQDTNWYKKFFQEMFDSIPIKALCKISAVKRFGKDLNFMIEFYEKVQKMSQIIHICEFFRGQPVKFFTKLCKYFEIFSHSIVRHKILHNIISFFVQKVRFECIKNEK